MNSLGIVVIGRNEGDRLERCLRTLQASPYPVVYVDSGSSDGSCEKAQTLGAVVVNLDLARPFSAARARNAGFHKLQELHPDINFVQFVDGDCELLPGWLEAASQILDQQFNVVAVCGLVHERYPENSIYNRICNLEWRMVLGQPGETTHFGGIVMIRADAFKRAGGYNETIIAAEDDELSIRLRQGGGKVLCINQDCCLHDANMRYFGQWWQRAKRCGFAFAQVSRLHGQGEEGKFVKEIRQVWLWGLGAPVLALVLALPSHGASLFLLGRYPLSALKVAYQTHRQGFPWKDSVAWGVSCSVSPLPGVWGAIQFHLNDLTRKPHALIEYKTPETSSH